MEEGDYRYYLWLQDKLHGWGLKHISLTTLSKFILEKRDQGTMEKLLFEHGWGSVSV